MKRIFLLTFTLASFSVFSQNFEREINDQVWKPFITAYNAYDVDGFLSVHSRDLVRVPRDSKTVLNFEEYKNRNQEDSNRAKAEGHKRNIQLRFLERSANESQAYEVGVYKMTITGASGESKAYYGKFQVVLRKENGTWKILVDSDTSEGRTITEKEFQEAKTTL